MTEEKKATMLFITGNGQLNNRQQMVAAALAQSGIEVSVQMMDGKIEGKEVDHVWFSDFTDHTTQGAEQEHHDNTRDNT